MLQNIDNVTYVKGNLNRNDQINTALEIINLLEDKGAVYLDAVRIINIVEDLLLGSQVKVNSYLKKD